MSEAPPPYGWLISILFSSKPLTSELAIDLYQLAHRLHHSGEAVGQLKADLVQGTVNNLKQNVALGAIAGPLFEAEVDTELGHTSVRFVVTRQGLELGAAGEPRKEALN